MSHSTDNHLATRKYFQSGDIKLSYLDYGGESTNVLLLLHGHMNDARTFSAFAEAFQGRMAWHVSALQNNVLTICQLIKIRFKAYLYVAGYSALTRGRK